MSLLTNNDVQQLYRLNSADGVTTPKEDFANKELKAASWMTRKVVSLQESQTKSTIVKLINALFTKIFSLLLFKSSNQVIARRAEILNFEFVNRDNYLRLVNSVPELGKPTSNVKVNFTNDKKSVQLTPKKNGPGKAKIEEVVNDQKITWSIKFGKINANLIEDGKLAKNAAGEFYFDEFVKRTKATAEADNAVAK